MAGPFDLSSIFGGGGDSSSGGSPATVAPSSGGIFDPSNGAGSVPGQIGADIGRLFGLPDANQRKAAADAEIMKDLSEIHAQNGGNPQKAILQFLQTPQGQKLFSTPGAVDTLTTWTKAITPPTPQTFNTPAGTQTSVMDPNNPGKTMASVSQPTTEMQNYQGGVPTPVTTAPGSQTNVLQKGQPTNTFSAPTTEVQNFNALTGKMAGLKPEELSQLAVNALNPGEVQQKALAVAGLVKNGAIDQDMGNKLLAGTIDIKEEMNDNGEKTGRYILTDKATGAGKVINPVGQGLPTTSAPGTPTIPGAGKTPALPQGSVNPDGTVDPSKAFNAKDSMGLGVGPLATGVAFAGHILRSFNPGNDEQSSLATSARRDAILRMRTALVEVGGSNGRLKSKVESWLKQAPDTGPMGDPKDTYRNLIDLHDDLKAQIASEQETARDFLHQPHANIKEAKENVIRLQNVLDHMPTRETSVMMYNNLTKGTAGAITPVQAGRSIAGMAVDAGKGAVETVGGMVKQPTTPTQPGAQPQAQPAAATDFSKMDAAGLAQVPMTPQNAPMIKARALELKNAQTTVPGKGTTAPAKQPATKKVNTTREMILRERKE